MYMPYQIPYMPSVHVVADWRLFFVEGTGWPKGLCMYFRAYLRGHAVTILTERGPANRAHHNRKSSSCKGGILAPYTRRSFSLRSSNVSNTPVALEVVQQQWQNGKRAALLNVDWLMKNVELETRCNRRQPGRKHRSRVLWSTSINRVLYQVETHHWLCFQKTKISWYPIQLSSFNVDINYFWGIHKEFFRWNCRRCICFQSENCSTCQCFYSLKCFI